VGLSLICRLGRKREERGEKIRKQKGDRLPRFASRNSKISLRKGGKQQQKIDKFVCLESVWKKKSSKRKRKSSPSESTLVQHGEGKEVQLTLTKWTEEGRKHANVGGRGGKRTGKKPKRTLFRGDHGSNCEINARESKPRNREKSDE